MSVLRRLALLLAILCLSSGVLSAQAALDAVANGHCENTGGGTICTSGDTVLTFALTVAANSNRSLAVGVFISCNSGATAPAVSSVTWDTTQSLAAVQQENPAATRRGELWKLANGTQPNTGTHNVVITMASSLQTACATSYVLNGGAFSAYNVDQTTNFTSSAKNSGTGTTASLTLSSSGANDLGIHAVCAGDGLTSTTETSKWNVTNTANSCGSNGGATAAGSDTSFSWTIPNDSWIMVGAAFKAASAGSTVYRGTLMGVGP